MTEEQYEIIDSIIEDYICHYDVFFGYNSSFFYNLYINKKELNINEEKLPYQKSSATETLKKIKEYYSKFYPEVLEKLDKAFNSGIFNIHYRDEDLDLDDLYLSSKEDIVFYQNENIINIPLFGDVRDIMITAHEIRHFLNQPNEAARNNINDLLTEGLSQFEEYQILEFLYNKGEINYKDRLKYYNYEIIKFKNLRRNVIFILELIITKQQLGKINLENYRFLFKNNDTKIFEANCESFLNDHGDFEANNWHLLGHFLNAYMIEQYENSDNFIEKFKKLNDKLLNNSGIECLNDIGLDFNSDQVISRLDESMKYLESKFCKEKTK